MKKVNFLIAAALFAVSSAFVSCSDDEDIAPASITFDNVSNNSVTLSAGATTYMLNATITSEANLKSIKVSKKVGSDITQVGSEVTKFDTKTTHHLNQLISDITADCEITVTVNNGTETGKVLTIKYTAPVQEPTVTVRTNSAVKIFCNAGDGISNSSAASADGSVYQTKTATLAQQGKIDFIYHHTASKGTMYSPYSLTTTAGNEGLVNWDVKRATLFQVLTDVTFANVNAENIESVVGTPSATTADIEKDAVVAFKTADNKIGVFVVKEITEGYSPTTDYCTIDIKVVE